MYMAVFGGIFAGYWLSGWSFRSKNKKLKQKYQKDIAVCLWGGLLACRWCGEG